MFALLKFIGSFIYYICYNYEIREIMKIYGRSERFHGAFY